MQRARLLFLALMVTGGALLFGCGGSQSELPTQEKIQQQLERDAAMRAEEDRLEREAAQK
jgi:hypothetical protein